MKTYWDTSALIEALHAPRLRSRIRRGENGTRPHSLAEVFSTLTKGVNFRYPPADAANMAADLAKDLDFVELSQCPRSRKPARSGCGAPGFTTSCTPRLPSSTALMSC